MASWMAQRFHNNPGWTHQYTKNGSLWTCDSLYDAFCQYTWSKQNWINTKSILNKYSYNLKQALKNGNVNNVINVCYDILQWGGVISGNITYLHCRQNSILLELQKMRGLISANQIPSNLHVPSNYNCKTKYPQYRMNAGFCKIYSLLCNHCIMYDSRVAAALGLLVRQFCESTNRFCQKKNCIQIPDNLKFGYLDSRSTANRNPNIDTFNYKYPICYLSRPAFPKLSSQNPLRYTEYVMRASWLLELALTKNPNKFSTGQDGFHELAAGLFMIGYEI